MRWVVALIAAIAIGAVVFAAVDDGELSPETTARLIHQGTNSRRVTCVSARGDLSSWDYQCKVVWRAGLGPPTWLGVNVNGAEITDSTAP
jgi:hypothetical protein